MAIAIGVVFWLESAAQVASPCDAYCVCTPSARCRSLVQNPLRGAVAVPYERRQCTIRFRLTNANFTHITRQAGCGISASCIGTFATLNLPFAGDERRVGYSSYKGPSPVSHRFALGQSVTYFASMLEAATVSGRYT